MFGERKRITVKPDSELGILLKDAVASRSPILVDTGEVVYTVEVAPATDEAAEPANAIAKRQLSPEEIVRSQEGIRKAAGSWRSSDSEGFKSYIAERRRTSSRPPVEL